MAVKRGKKQARRKDEPAIPGYVWLFTGLLIGGAVAVMFWVKMPHTVNDLLPHPNSTATPTTASASSPAVPEGNPPDATPKKRKYDFYEVLPEREVVIPDEELSAQVKAEAAANLAAKQQAALASGAASTAAPTATTGTANTAAMAANTATNTTSPSANATTGTTKPAIANASTPSPATTATASTDASTSASATEPKSGQYLLQAGAFKNNEQADDLKARIAMLGLIGHVETVQTPAGEMHRVRLGPYATASELEAAKQKLSTGGLPAIAVRVK